MAQGMKVGEGKKGADLSALTRGRCCYGNCSYYCTVVAFSFDERRPKYTIDVCGFVHAGGFTIV